MSKTRTLASAAAALSIALASLACSSASDSLDMPSPQSLMEVVMPDSVPAQMLHYNGFSVNFNPRWHEPNWVAWELTAEEASSQTHGRANSFAPDLYVEQCATLSDYRRSGFDRGHMCPSGDMKWDSLAMRDCFLLTNICPQDKTLNAGSWRILEENCRSWARRDDALIIICGPVLTDKITRTIGDSQVGVPERFFKVVLAPYADPPRAIGFVMDNTPYTPGGVQGTAVSIDEVEAITGFDFFSALPDQLESEIESQCNYPLWNQRHPRQKHRRHGK